MIHSIHRISIATAEAVILIAPLVMVAGFICGAEWQAPELLQVGVVAGFSMLVACGVIVAADHISFR